LVRHRKKGFARSTTDFARSRQVSFLTPLSDKPQSYNPRHLNSVRILNPFAPPETRRFSERDSGGPYAWNDRNVNENQIRASLFGKQ